MSSWTWQALHGAGIEIVLDVVFNHTAEGDGNGPTYSYRGFDDSSDYRLQPDRLHYRNDAGTGTRSTVQSLQVLAADV